MKMPKYAIVLCWIAIIVCAYNLLIKSQLPKQNSVNHVANSGVSNEGQQSADIKLNKQQDKFGEYKDMSWKKLLNSKPKLYRAIEFPPTNNEVVRMWQWWNAMYRADPDHEWKTPIEFFGIVLDEKGRPVEGATVTYSWVQIGKVGRATKHSLWDGTFAIKEIVGSRILINVGKVGYMNSLTSNGRFQYGDKFADDKFHVPDKNNPVKFVIRKSNKEPDIKIERVSYKMSRDDKIVWVNPFSECRVTIENALFGVSCRSQCNFENGKQDDFTVTLYAPPGGGFYLNQGEEYMLEAPSSGYMNQIHFEQFKTNDTYTPALPLSFYFRTADGLYGCVPDGLLARCWDFEGIVILNPNKTRNLDVGSFILPTILQYRQMLPFKLMNQPDLHFPPYKFPLNTTNASASDGL